MQYKPQALDGWLALRAIVDEKLRLPKLMEELQVQGR